MNWTEVNYRMPKIEQKYNEVDNVYVTRSEPVMVTTVKQDVLYGYFREKGSRIIFVEVPLFHDVLGEYEYDLEEITHWRRMPSPAAKREESRGFRYTLNDDGESYTIKERQQCKDSDVVLPAVHKQKPVTNISIRLFAGKDTLTSVVIPETFTSIRSYAFCNCSALTRVTIPASVQLIEEYSFADCKNLKMIIYRGTVEQWSVIKRCSNWDLDTGKYTVCCVDGNIKK